MAVNKVVFNSENGEQTLIDLTEDTVTPATLAEGATAHAADGSIITGTAKQVSVVQTTGNSATDVMSQKAVTDALNGVSETVSALHTETWNFELADGSTVSKVVYVR